MSSSSCPSPAPYCYTHCTGRTASCLAWPWALQPPTQHIRSIRHSHAHSLAQSMAVGNGARAGKQYAPPQVVQATQQCEQCAMLRGEVGGARSKTGALRPGGRIRSAGRGPHLGRKQVVSWLPDDAHAHRPQARVLGRTGGGGRGAGRRGPSRRANKRIHGAGTTNSGVCVCVWTGCVCVCVVCTRQDNHARGAPAARMCGPCGA